MSTTKTFLDVGSGLPYMWLTRANVEEVAAKSIYTPKELIQFLDYYEELGNHHVKIQVKGDPT